MISGSKIKTLFTLFIATLSLNTAYAAEQQVGRFVQLRGAATIERGRSQIPARVKGSILANDTITTAKASRAKLLFIDDSVLTMSDNSKLVVSEFIHEKGKQGKSVFNLLDGKMRSVVGKTRFEVRTPTAVAAARGTVIYFDVGSINNQNYSRIICLEGTVQVRNIVGTVAGQVTLTPGTMVVVKANEPPPAPIPAPPAELEKAKRLAQAGSAAAGDNSTPSGSTSLSGNNALPNPNSTPPLQQQPALQPRKVNINIGIPGQ